MEKNKKVLIGAALSAVIFIAALGGGIFYLVFTATRPLTESADSFLTLLGQQKFQEAYDATSNGFKDHTNEPTLEAVAVQEHLDQYASSDWSSRSIENDKGTLNGTVTLTNGNKIPVEVDLLKENDVWKVYGVTSQGGGMQQESSPETTTTESDYLPPSDEESAQMAQEVLTLFSLSLKAGDFGTLYDSASAKWQSQTTPEKLDEAFKDFLDSKLDFSGLESKPVVLSDAPTVNAQDQLVIKGSVADVPKNGQDVVFEVMFIPEDEQWQIFGLDVSVE